jgi:hypothetical protein
MDRQELEKHLQCSSYQCRTGATENYKHRGIIPRAISQLYRDIEDNANLAVTVRISFVEIYNEQLVDLLGETNESSENISIVEEKNGCINLYRNHSYEGSKY